MTNKTQTIAHEYRAIATDAVKMLKSIPFYDIRQRLAVEALYDRLADNDIALKDAARKAMIVDMKDAVAPAEEKPAE